MKTSIAKWFFLSVLIAALGLLLAGRVTAQTFTTLHNFAGSPNDGSEPYAGLILLSNTLYGTSYFGGSSGSGGSSNSGNGTVFAVSTNGISFTNIYSFSQGSYSALYSYVTNGDGVGSEASLILSGNTFYGTAGYGGTTANGTLFRVNIDGTDFTNLHNFTALLGSDPPTNSDGGDPDNNMIFVGNTLYGTASEGGVYGNGTIFALNTNGTGFTNLYSFTAALGSNYTNSDGAAPNALVLSGNVLFGTTEGGGTNGNGTIFAVNTNGTGFKVLHTFSAGIGNADISDFVTNSDGADPVGSLILVGNTLYGTASEGGTNGNGTIFAINTNGAGFAILHTFSAASEYTNFSPINTDGAIVQSGLILVGSNLLATASSGGTNGNGTIFSINTNGTVFTVLHAFTAESNSFPYATNSDGGWPDCNLVLLGNAVYGTVSRGGVYGEGTVFSLTLASVTSTPPQLKIISSGNNVILTWPTNAISFTLQSTTNLIPPSWSTVSPAPVVVNTNNAVTNSISGTQKFYRLSQ